VQLALPAYGYKAGRTFGPSEPQQAFHKMDSRFVYLRAGAGAGKSHAGAREFITRILEDAEARPANLKGLPVRYVAAAPTIALCDAGPWSHVLAWFAAFKAINGFSLIKKIHRTWPRKLTLIDGSEILFTHLKDAQQFAGLDVIGGYLDEAELAPSPLASFQAMNNRLRGGDGGNWAIITSTPRAGASLATHFADRIEQGDEHYSMMVAPSYSNPGLPPGYVESMRATMSAREAAMMIDGQIVQASGTIFGHEFHRQKSIDRKWKWHGGPRRDRSYFLAIDHVPHGHCLMVEFDPATGVYTVFDEVISDADQADQFYDRIVKRLKDKWKMRRDHIDLVYQDAQPPYARNLLNTPRYFGGRCRWRTVRGERRDKETGIDTVRWALCAADGTRRLKFAPHLLVAKHRRGVVASFTNYTEIQTVRDGQIIRTSRFDNASPWGHACDAARYLLWIRESHRRLHDAYQKAA